MRDYSLTDEESENFIKGYDVEGDNLVLSMGDGDVSYVKNTYEQELEILDYMEEQVEDSADFVEDQYFQISESKKALKREFLILLIKLFFFPGLSIPHILITVSILGLMMLDVVTITMCKKSIKDVEKHLYFLDNKEIINDNVRNSEEMLNNVSEMTKEIIRTSSDDRPALNINTVGDVSYEDLEQIVDNILQEQDRNGICSEDIKKRTRKR